MSLSIEIVKEIAKIGWFSANRGTHKQFDAMLAAINELDEEGFLGRVPRIKNHQTSNREIDLVKATGLTAAGWNYHKTLDSAA